LENPCATARPMYVLPEVAILLYPNRAHGSLEMRQDACTRAPAVKAIYEDGERYALPKKGRTSSFDFLVSQ
jgi:hypothetical protein